MIVKSLFREPDLLHALHRYLSSAVEMDLALSLATTAGLNEIHRSMMHSLGRGGRARILIGTDLPTEPDAIEHLLTLQKHFSKCTVRRFDSPSDRIFHPKLILVRTQRDSQMAILGSSNLTRRGLVDNFEANVLLDHPRSVSQFRAYFDELFEGGRSHAITNSWLRSYRRIWGSSAST